MVAYMNHLKLLLLAFHMVGVLNSDAWPSTDYSSPVTLVADPSGSIPSDLGGTRGVPLTFFYDRTGALVELHSGVIDERTLALQIDEILRR